MSVAHARRPMLTTATLKRVWFTRCPSPLGASMSPNRDTQSLRTGPTKSRWFVFATATVLLRGALCGVVVTTTCYDVRNM